MVDDESAGAYVEAEHLPGRHLVVGACHHPALRIGLERGGSLLLGWNLDGWGELTLGEVGGIGALADEGRDHLLVDLPDAVVGLWELWFEHLEVSPSGEWSVRHLSPG